MIMSFLNGDFPNTTSWSTKWKLLGLVFAFLLAVLHGLIVIAYTISGVLAIFGLFGGIPLTAAFGMIVTILFFTFFGMVFLNISKRLYKEIKNENP